MKRSITTDSKFGMLTVTDSGKVDVHGNYMYQCKCDCGNYKYYYAWQLKKGDSVSCGCAKSDRLKTSNVNNPPRKNTAQRQKSKRDHIKSLGLVEARVPCHPDDREIIKEHGEKLLEKRGISYHRKRGRKPNEKKS